MTYLQDHEVTVNMALFKRYRFYQLFDPDGPRAFGYGVHRALSVAAIVAVLAVNAFSALGFLADTGAAAAAADDSADTLLIMFMYCVNAISFLKIAVFLRRSPVVWRLFDATRVDYLTGGRCRGNVAILHRYRDTATALTDYFFKYVSAVFALWCAVPLANVALAGTDDGGGGGGGRRKQNVFNMMYPVTAAVFNRYFGAFYLMEVTMGAFILYNSVLIDIFLVSMCFATAAQLEVLGTAFASIGNDDGGGDDDGCKNNNSKAIEDFKSTLYDQIQVYKTLKSFYSVVWIIVVSLIFVNSIVMTILSYSFIVVK